MNPSPAPRVAEGIAIVVVPSIVLIIRINMLWQLPEVTLLICEKYSSELNLGRAGALGLLSKFGHVDVSVIGECPLNA